MTLKLGNGGSKLTFLPDMKCCVPSCGAVRDDDNLTMPYYTLPSDANLCREWLKEFQVNEDEVGDLSNLHSTLAVCSKHFILHRSGVRLCINNETTSGQQINENLLSIMSGNSQVSVSQVKIPSKVSTGTQTVDNEWVKDLKNELNLDIFYGSHIQCRVCAKISVQAVRVYSKCNKESNEKLSIHKLINSLLPIKVNPTDTKPLNICVHCLFILEQFTILYKRCLKTDKDFDVLNERIKSTNKITNPLGQKTNLASEVIHDFVLDNDTQNTDAIVLNDDSKEITTDEHNMNKSKLSKLTSKSSGFIKEETCEFNLSTIVNFNDESKKNNNEKNQFSNIKVIHVKCMVKYTIFHNEKQIIEINILNKDELKYSKESIDKIIKIIEDILKNQSGKNNSKIDSSPILPLHLDSIVTPCQQVQTSVIIERKTHLNTKLFKESESLKKIWECESCGLKLNNEESYITHIKKHLLQQHEKPLKIKPEKLKKKKLMCSKCFQLLSSKFALRVHMRRHLPVEERKKICPTCNKVFINDYRFKMHVKNHDQCLVKCLECSRSFPSQEHLDNHLRYHKMTKSVNCDLCHRKFKTESTLKTHINRIHKGNKYVQKKFICVFCKNVFASKDELFTHRNTHTLEENRVL